MSEILADTEQDTKCYFFLWFALYSSLFLLVVDTASEDVPNMHWDIPHLERGNVISVCYIFIFTGFHRKPWRLLRETEVTDQRIKKPIYFSILDTEEIKMLFLWTYICPSLEQG